MIAAIGFAAKSLGSVKTKFCFSSGDGIATGKAEISGITTGRIGGGILIVSVRSLLSTVKDIDGFGYADGHVA